MNNKTNIHSDNIVNAASAVYCSIPEELKKNGLFCLWRRETRKGSTTKVPYRPDGRNACPNNRSTFVSFDEAISNPAEYDGIGLGIFDGWCAIDIDHCYKDGKLSDMAEDIISTISSYTEKSPSGEGIRIIFRADNFHYDKEKYYINNRNLGLEVYISGVTNKYVTLTGNALVEGPVHERSAEIAEILEKYMLRPQSTAAAGHITARAAQTPPAPAQPASPNAENCDGNTRTPAAENTWLFNKIVHSKQGAKFLALWNGEIPEGKSHSEADLSLCAILAFWCKGDIAAIDSMFQQSRLYRKEKWERESYSLPTLNRAVSFCTKFYKG